ncbi:hypothetical protein [Actinomadura sp. 9N407]
MAVSDGEKSTVSGPKGFAIVLGAMLGVMLVLWGIGYLVAP